MRSVLIFTIIISCSFAFSATQVYGIPLYIPFHNKVEISDLIVEGIVEKQTDNPDYERGNINSYRKSSLLAVTKVFKGSISVGDKITVFSHMNFACDTSGQKIVEGRRLLLMLKKHKSGFADVNTGNGIWEIVTLKTDQKFVVGPLTYRAWAQSYEEFEKDLTWVLSKPQLWSGKPAVSLEDAKRIAEDAFSKTNIDLKEFELIKHEFKYSNSSITGVAHVGDPVWYFHWVKDQTDSPKRKSVSCHIHAHTGNIYTSNFQPKIPPAKTLCSLFLKTNRFLRKTYSKYADNISITKLTEEGFNNLYPGCGVVLHEKPVYTEGTNFLRIDFPDSNTVEPVLIVLDKTKLIEYAGIVISDP